MLRIALALSLATSPVFAQVEFAPAVPEAADQVLPVDAFLAQQGVSVREMEAPLIMRPEQGMLPSTVFSVVTAEGDIGFVEVPFGMDPSVAMATGSELHIFFGEDAENFLTRRLRSAYSQARAAACQLHAQGMAPQSIDAALSIGFFSIAASWSTDGMCD